MKNRFWISIAGFIGVCFVLLAVGGLYFLTLQEGQAAKARVKKSLSRESAFYLKELNKKILKFNRSAETILEERNRKDSSLFTALAFVDLESHSVEPVFPPVFDKGQDSFSAELFREFLEFADTKVAARTSFHFLSGLGPDWLVVVTPLRSFPKSRGLLWAGVVKSADFFKFSKASDRDALIINSQGRLFFSFQRRPGLFPSKSILKKFLKKAAQKKKTGWYVRRRGGSRQGSNLFHLRPWPETNLFVISGGKFSQPLFVWTRSGSLWLFFCFSLGLILFFGLALFIRPLRSAYEALREELIYMARTGKRRSLPKAKNPFLAFNSHIISEEKTSLSTNALESDSPAPLPTFQDLLKQKEQRFKEKFPGLSLTTCLDTNISLAYFHRAMKKILQELLSNAIEAMGSVESQNITVTAREEGEFFVLSVRDFGSGLKEEEKKKAFKLYYSTKSHLGVGLNLVQSIVSSHEGTVKLLSPVDGGLEAQVSLPLKCFSPAAEYPLASLKESAAGLEKHESPLSRAIH